MLNFLRTTVCVITILFALHQNLGGALMGLVMSNAMDLSNILHSIVYTCCHAQDQIGSLQRINEYTYTKPEAEWQVSSNAKNDVSHGDDTETKNNKLESTAQDSPVIEWPTHGAITFTNYSTKYRPELDLVVRDINIQILPGEKVSRLSAVAC